MSVSVLFAFGAMIFWGLGDFLIQKSVRRIGPLEILFWITAGSSVILLPLVWTDLLSISQGQLILLLSLGALVFVSGWIHFQALKIGKLSVVEAILSIELPITVFLGLIFFHEQLNWLQICLLFAVFLGIILVAVKFSDIKGRDFLEKGALLALISGLVMGCINFLTASVAKDISPIMSIYLPWLFVACLSWFFMRRQRAKAEVSFLKKSRLAWSLILVTVIVDIFAWLCFAWAVRYQELAITIAITESYVVVALLLGVWINKEKINLWQYMGATLAISGSLLMGLINF